MKKGGLTWETIGTWVIVLAAAIVLFLVIYFLKDVLYQKFSVIKDMFGLT